MVHRVRVDIGHLLGEDDAHNFVSRAELQQISQSNVVLFEEVRQSLANGTSPITRSFEVATLLPEIRALASQLRARYENILILGIGGSTLGFRAILQALRGPFYNLQATSKQAPRVFILDNVDPILADHLSEILDFRRTALVYVSKSGSTPEPAANFVHFHRKYREAGGSLDDLVIICDEADNGINHIAERSGCHLLHIPSDLPGRYTVISAAGLLPAELVQVDAAQVLEGARAAHRHVIHDELEKNAVFALGNCMSALVKKGKSIHVLFNYGNFLSELGLWFVQLWAESLGKTRVVGKRRIGVGTTPLSAIGATDQHSLLQLFKEGPNDKIFGFVSVDRLPKDVPLGAEFPTEIEYSYFAGHTMGEQLRIEQVSTEVSLVRAGRPCYRMTLANLTPADLGALFYFFESLVVYLAALWKVNPFDQPGVEEGKSITYGLMGRDDYVASVSSHEADIAEFERRSRILSL